MCCLLIKLNKNLDSKPFQTDGVLLFGVLLQAGSCALKAGAEVARWAGLLYQFI